MEARSWCGTHRNVGEKRHLFLKAATLKLDIGVLEDSGNKMMVVSCKDRGCLGF